MASVMTRPELSWALSYTDGQGTDETVISVGALAVENVNDAPTGSLVFNSFKDEDSALTVTSSLAYEDGLDTLAYQWLRDGKAISGEARDTYTLGESDVGARISVSASYTDGCCNLEQVISPRTTTIAERVDIRTTSQADHLNGTVRPDVIDGLAGADIITVGGGSDQVYGSDGDDYIFGDKAAAS